jgi:hypothetical protein
MNLINMTVYRNNIKNLANWVDTTPVPDVIDTMTYDLYESNNPFRKHFSENEIPNKGLRITANTTTLIGAEFFSAFTNPYYLMHKITGIPTVYHNAVDTYSKITHNNKN